MWIKKKLVYCIEPITMGLIAGAGIGAAAGALTNQDLSVDMDWDQEVANDASMQIAKGQQNLYDLGDTTPYGDQPVSPYKSTDQNATGSGYYFDTQRGVYIDEEAYRKKSKNGKKALNPERYEWRETPLESGAGEAAGGAEIDEKIQAVNLSLIDPIGEFVKKDIAISTENLESKGDAEKAANEASQAKSGIVINTAAGETSAINTKNQQIVDVAPGQTRAIKAQNRYAADYYGAKSPVMQKYFQEASEGINVQDRVDLAAQSTSHQYDKSKGIYERQMRGLGVDAADIASGMGDWARSRAKDTVSATMTAKDKAEAINWDRLQGAMGV